MANEVIIADNAVLSANLEACQWSAKRYEVLNRGSALKPNVISSNDDLETFTQVQTDAKKLVKELEKNRKELTGPLDERKKAICNCEKTEAKALNQLIDDLDAKIKAYAREQARKAEEERIRIEAEERARAEAELARQQQAEAAARQVAEANAAFGLGTAAVAPQPEPVAPPPVVRVPTVEKAHASAASFTEVWKFDILDMNAVPRELCSPDERKIRAFMMAKKAEGYLPEQIQVGGIRFYTDVQVRAR